MNNHFTADLHLDHENVLAMSGRLFPNILEHDNHMIAQINRFVPRGDRLFILGDVSWFSVENYLARLHCKDVHLIGGNHDRNKFGASFKTAEDVTAIKIQGHKVFLSHYPHAYWPSSHHGSFHLYGHCHRQREATLDAAFPGRRSLDVGVDNALHLLGEYRPFTEDEIVAILGNRPGHDLLPFYADFQAKLPKYGASCGFVPPTTDYAGCTREKGHTGPCAHEFVQEHDNLLPTHHKRPRPLRDNDELKAQAIREAVIKGGEMYPTNVIRDIIGKLRDMEEAEDYERVQQIKRNRPNPPEMLEFGGQSRP